MTFTAATALFNGVNTSDARSTAASVDFSAAYQVDGVPFDLLSSNACSGGELRGLGVGLATPVAEELD
jgi:hypothetical protein